MRVWLITELLLLLVVANATPAALGLMLGERWNRPLDGGRLFLDQRPLFGKSKTVRGVLSAIAASTVCAPLAGFTLLQGALFGALAMTGDLLSSFTKRRLGYPSHCSRPLLDQLPETLLPLLVTQPLHHADALEMSVAILGFTVIDLLLSRLVSPRQAACKR